VADPPHAPAQSSTGYSPSAASFVPAQPQASSGIPNVSGLPQPQSCETPSPPHLPQSSISDVPPQQIPNSLSQ